MLIGGCLSLAVRHAACLLVVLYWHFGAQTPAGRSVSPGKPCAATRPGLCRVLVKLRGISHPPLLSVKISLFPSWTGVLGYVAQWHLCCPCSWSASSRWCMRVIKLATMSPAAMAVSVRGFSPTANLLTLRYSSWNGSRVLQSGHPDVARVEHSR